MRVILTVETETKKNRDRQTTTFVINEIEEAEPIVAAIRNKKTKVIRAFITITKDIESLS